MYDRKISDAKYRNRPEIRERRKKNCIKYYIEHLEASRLRANLWYHNNKERAKVSIASYRIQCKNEHRCPICGRALHPEMDEGHINCLNCRLIKKNNLPPRRIK